MQSEVNVGLAHGDAAVRLVSSTGSLPPRWSPDATPYHLSAKMRFRINENMVRQTGVVKAWDVWTHFLTSLWV